jgi:transcriptional regulator with GAF, ATPase, and Fis domain
MTESREVELLSTFAILADTLVTDYDIVDLLQTLVDRCQVLLDTTAAGILLADGDGDLELIVSTSEASRLVETMQISAAAGPCIESYTSGLPVTLADIAEAPPEWSLFRDRALELGFHSVHAIPLKLRETTIGTLNLLREAEGLLPEHDLIAAQALADVATIGIIQERTLRESDAVRRQLQHALNSRVVIEQAKGVVAHQRSIDPERAFDLMRDYARSRRLSISHVARALVERTLTI